MLRLLLIASLRFFPQVISSPETQLQFKKAISNTFTLSYEYWMTEKKQADTAKEFQIDISSALNINSSL